jgi:glycerate 2-kinase
LPSPRTRYILAPMKETRVHLESIFLAGVRSVDPARLVARKVTLEGESRLTFLDGDGRITEDLSLYDSVIIIGAGKATAPMARAMEEVLGSRLTGGVISVKYGHGLPLTRIELIEAGHPVPDDNSLRAARRIVDAARKAGERTLVIGLISGGGSSLLACPLDTGEVSLTLEDLRETTGALLRSGARIDEMNCIRKHLSAVKGGRLVGLLHPARQINLILSDVVGDPLDSIASGMTTADPTSFQDALRIVDRYGIADDIPAGVRAVLEAGARGDLPDTPKEGDALFERVDNVILGSNRIALAAAAVKAAELGYDTVTLSSRITGEAREIAHVYAGIAADLAAHDGLVSTPACVLGGGETTVTIKGEGKGGRNQEMALSFLLDLAEEPPEIRRRVSFLAASTDGNDGPTDAAGAFVLLHGHVGDEMRSEAEDALRRNDSYTFFARKGGLLRTGPTNTNVCDMQVIIVR